MNELIKKGVTISFIPAYTGATTVVGVVSGTDINYKVAKLIGGDIEAVHAQVRMLKPDIDSIENLDFFTITVNDRQEVFSDAWLTDGTLVVLEEASYVELRIYGVTTVSLPTLRSYLQTGGYKSVKLIGSSS